MWSRSLFCAIFAMLLLVRLSSSRSADGIDVDLELVLAVDISNSMDEEELRLQRDGYVSAFRHLEVLQAIESGRYRRIAVTYLEWAGADLQFVRVPWRLIDTDAAAEAFARRLENVPLKNASRTSLSGVLRFAAGLFEGSGFSGTRRIIDISGDGTNNSGSPVAAMRDSVVRRGIVINGLPLMLRPAYLSGFADAVELNDYYRDCVIGGTGSFLLTVEKLPELTLAIRRKLILEMAGLEPSVLNASLDAGRQKVDCLIGEKLHFEDR